MDKPLAGKTAFMIIVSGNYIFNKRKREGGEEEKKSKQRRGSKYTVHCGWRYSLQTDFRRQQRSSQVQRPQTLASARVSSQGKGRCAPSEYSGKECCGGSPIFILLNAGYNVCLLGSRKTQTAQINRPPDMTHQMRPNQQDSPEQCHQWTQPLMFWCEYGENHRGSVLFPVLGLQNSLPGMRKGCRRGEPGSHKRQQDWTAPWPTATRTLELSPDKYRTTLNC